jgi:hypothetical protein
VFSALVFFIVLREIAMKLVLAPIARRYVGTSSASLLLRIRARSFVES